MPRPLTHDEQKAAEAAFQNEPFEPSWSEAARKVYEGIRRAIRERRYITYDQGHPEDERGNR